MSEQLLALMPTLVPLVIGALLAWIGSFLSDYRRSKADRSTQQTALYARWITLMDIALLDMGRLQKIAYGRPGTTAETEALLGDTNALLQDIKQTLEAGYSIAQVDRRPEQRDGVLEATDALFYAYARFRSLAHQLRELNGIEVRLEEVRKNRANQQGATGPAADQSRLQLDAVSQAFDVQLNKARDRIAASRDDLNEAISAFESVRSRLETTLFKQRKKAVPQTAAQQAIEPERAQRT